jgi:sterol 14-demethylase
MITESMERRRASGRTAHDALQVLMDSRYSDGTALTPNEITGILTAAMFAGHHTSSGTEAWTLIELMRHPEWMARVVAEVDEIYAREGGLTYQAFREVPVLEAVLKEVLRLHPPLIILMRGVLRDFTAEGVTIPEGSLVAISPPVSHAMPELFPDPERFDPGRYVEGRAEDERPFAWIPFGGGLHRCSGSAFALMQLKAITMSLVRRFEFELGQPAGAYRPDYTKLVVQPALPCPVRYRRRRTVAAGTGARHGAASRTGAKGAVRVRVDLGLCQGHAVCVSEAPEVFRLNAQQSAVEVLQAEVPTELRTRVAAAAKHCPTHAITVEDD